MSAKRSRKEAINEYRQRPPNRGAFAVRCAATGDVWVGASPNLDAARNSTWFALRARSHRERSMQEVWNEYGEGAFTFEVLETLAADVAAMRVADELKRLKTKWARQLFAPELLA